MELQPDIVTMDITMKDMNGLEALKAIMERDKSKYHNGISNGQEAMVKMQFFRSQRIHCKAIQGRDPYQGPGEILKCGETY